MKFRLLRIWETISVSFWFLPMLIILFSIVSASFFVYIDRLIFIHKPEVFPKYLMGGATGARAVLSTIAASMITVASIVFSITFVTLGLASSQLGPRAVRNFMKSRMNQVVLGAYVSAFIYCLIVMRSVNTQIDTAFIPNVAVLMGMVQALINILLLIFFIHNISMAIQADNVIARISAEFERKIKETFSKIADEGQKNIRDCEQEFVDLPYSHSLFAPQSNYLMAINSDLLFSIADRLNLIIKIHFKPGDFICRNAELMEVRSLEQIDQEVSTQLVQTMNYNGHRTGVQDVEFLVLELVEIACRALSPGINDPFTAITCIDKLGGIICDFSEFQFPSPYIFDKEQNLRLIMKTTTFDGFVQAAFNQIIQYAEGKGEILIRIMETFRYAAEAFTEKEHLTPIVNQADKAMRQAEFSIREPKDREKMKAIFGDLNRLLNVRTESFSRK